MLSNATIECACMNSQPQMHILTITVENTVKAAVAVTHIHNTRLTLTFAVLNVRDFYRV